MARTDTLGHFLTDVADAIREKKGSQATITASNFDTEIASISGGANLQSKNITIEENTTTNITPDVGYDGLSNVSVTTKVSIVPSEYTLVEYLETNGIGYIQTNYKTSALTNYDVVCQLIHEGKYDGCVFGSRSSGNSTDEFILWHNNGSDVTTESISPRRGYVLNNRYLSKTYTDSDFDWRHVMSVVDKAYVDDVNLGSYYQNNQATSPYNLTIFAISTAGNADTNRMYRGRVKYLKIYDALNLVFDFVPVIRKSDGVVGFYNLVDGAFYSNALSTNFTAGPVV